jgi:hypothetical protein
MLVVATKEQVTTKSSSPPSVVSKFDTTLEKDEEELIKTPMCSLVLARYDGVH